MIRLPLIAVSLLALAACHRFADNATKANTGDVALNDAEIINMSPVNTIDLNDNDATLNAMLRNSD